MIIKISIISIPLKPLQNKGLRENKNKKLDTESSFNFFLSKFIFYSPVK